VCVLSASARRLDASAVGSKTGELGRGVTASDLRTSLLPCQCRRRGACVFSDLPEIPRLASPAHQAAGRSSTRAMSDFTDDEDRQLVQLARMLSEPGQQPTDTAATHQTRRQINWDVLLQMMVGTHKSKAALRQRLKTLKRKYNKDLRHFPHWYFKKRFDNTAHAAWHADPPLITPPPRQASRPRKAREADVRRRILLTIPVIDEALVTAGAASTTTHTFMENTILPAEIAIDQQVESPLWALAVAAEIRSSADNPASQTKASIRFLLSHDAA
jgi:hypothetical protein